MVHEVTVSLWGILIGAAIPILVQIITARREHVARNYEHRRAALMDFLTLVYELREATQPNAVDADTVLSLKQRLKETLPRIGVFGSKEARKQAAHIWQLFGSTGVSPRPEMSGKAGETSGRAMYQSLQVGLVVFEAIVRRDLGVSRITEGRRLVIPLWFFNLRLTRWLAVQRSKEARPSGQGGQADVDA